jgi:nucleotide-binding universal stress UspA family protein
MTIVSLLRRLRAEFTAMPGLRLSEKQVQRLYDVDASTSASALRALVSAGLLRELDDGSYRRADLPSDLETRSMAGAAEPPWRRILCFVEFEADNHQSLTAASHSALVYATTLGVTHRARVTALRLVPSLPAQADEQQAFVEALIEDVRRHTRNHRIRWPFDVHVATGTANEDLLRAAGDIDADLIVIGRGDGRAARVSELREMLRDARCHVLVVHPSGQAAVA